MYTRNLDSNEGFGTQAAWMISRECRVAGLRCAARCVSVVVSRSVCWGLLYATAVHARVAGEVSLLRMTLATGWQTRGARICLPTPWLWAGVFWAFVLVFDSRCVSFPRPWFSFPVGVNVSIGIAIVRCPGQESLAGIRSDPQYGPRHNCKRWQLQDVGGCGEHLEGARPARRGGC